MRTFALCDHTSISRSAVRTGCRQSIPSSNIDNCAALSDTLPLCACGQTKRPRSKRLAIKHRPVPSHHNSLSKSPRRPRKTKICPQNGLLASACCTRALKPVKPLRMSVTPAASQIRVRLVVLVATTPIAATRLPERRSVRHPEGRFRSAASHPRQASVARYSRRLTAYQAVVAHVPQQLSSPVEMLPSARRLERAAFVPHSASQHDRALAIDRGYSD